VGIDQNPKIVETGARYTKRGTQGRERLTIDYCISTQKTQRRGVRRQYAVGSMQEKVKRKGQRA